MMPGYFFSLNLCQGAISNSHPGDQSLSASIPTPNNNAPVSLKPGRCIIWAYLLEQIPAGQKLDRTIVRYDKQDNPGDHHHKNSPY